MVETQYRFDPFLPLVNADKLKPMVRRRISNADEIAVNLPWEKKEEKATA